MPNRVSTVAFALFVSLVPVTPAMAQTPKADVVFLRGRIYQTLGPEVAS
jgi:hypothetical protein